MKRKTIVSNPYIIHIIEDKKLGKKFKGVARCNDDDTFDVNKGTQIAMLKAEIKRDRNKMNNLISDYKLMERFIENELNQTEKRVDELENKIQKKYEEISLIAE